MLQGCHNLNHLGKVLEGLQNNYCESLCESLKFNTFYFYLLGLVRCDKVSEIAVMELSSLYPKVFLSTVQTEMNKVKNRDIR